ncbi:MAG: hypothetical protein M1361_02610 [Patescibacteria group bacterium]|nr:hypothetical protein [Patescibacteria group bacterium]MCL5224467.1 hypothetical protein [Patescibacteria group bacterium]
MDKREVEEVNKYRALFPSEIKVSVERSENGDFLATIHTFSGLFTEASSFSELIEMVNDAVKTYFEIPDKFIPYVPNYIPPIEAAQKLDIFPIIQSTQRFVFPLSTSEAQKC